MLRIVVFSMLAVAASAGVASAGTPKPQASATPGALVPYDTFTKEAKAQHGLFTIWRKDDGTVALELKPEQFNADYVELGVPVNGIGDGGIFSGITDLQPCLAIRFVRQDDRVAILFPTTRFLASPNSPEALAVEAGTASTVAGVAKVLSVDDKTGDVVFDASPFLQDITNVAAFLTLINGGSIVGATSPLDAYHLDAANSYFGITKSFPDNIVMTVEQTFSTMNPRFIDSMPDARNIQLGVQYDIATLPKDDGYMPRLYDDRIGYFVNAHDDFSSDNSFDKSANYIVRWNMQPSDPSKRVSPAKYPVVYYLSNTIPYRYRGPIRKALLTWNEAFLPLGISNAVIVKDQPNDPSFDPDDIRYNVVRWLAEKEGGFAEAQLLYNPYTGEMIKSGIVIDSDLMRFGKFDYPLLVQRAKAAAAGRYRPSALGIDSYVEGERAQYSYGVAALSIMNDASGYHVPEKFADEYLESIVLHESGHDWGLRHNYLAGLAYTPSELRSAAFTRRYGVATSVMHYAPINLWPKGTSTGDYFQTVLGPYDYHAIHWGYARVPGAKTPGQERLTLDRWASLWSNPRYAYASDEDVTWLTGQAVDPRNQQWVLTNDYIGWCGTQMSMARRLIGRVDERFPRKQGPYDDLQMAFGSLLGHYGRCTEVVSRYIGGEYVSRAKRGDPHAALPLTAVPKSVQLRAFKALEANLFSADAWNFSPRLLRSAVTQYRYDDWDGNFAPRHDMAVDQIAATYQYVTLLRMFAPVTLERLDDASLKYGDDTMRLQDLFTWMQSAAFDDIAHPKGGNIPLVRRNLQRRYASILSLLAARPLPGTPQDAQALARYELGALHDDIQASLRNNRLDLMTRAHLASLDADIVRTLHSQVVIPVGDIL
jgi:hypothetical protein